MRRILSTLAAIIAAITVVLGGVIGAFALAADADAGRSGTTTEPAGTTAGTQVVAGASAQVRWDCPSRDTTQCPGYSGAQVLAALVWPAELNAASARMGWQTDHGVYLPSYTANGLVLRITSGVAKVYSASATTDQSSVLQTLSAGQSYAVGSLQPGQVLLVQNAGAGFTYRLTIPADVVTTDPSPTGSPTTSPSDSPTTPTSTPTSTPTPFEGTASGTSEAVTSTCTQPTVVGACPYGTGTVYGSGKPNVTDSSFGEQSLVWPDGLSAVTTGEYGYTAGAGIYLPAAQANGLTVTVTSGWAALLVGAPGLTPRTTYRVLEAGESVQVSGVADGRSLSVQGSASFGWTVSADPVDGSAVGPSAPSADCDGVVTDLAGCDFVSSVPVDWRCDPSACSVPTPDWSEQAVAWPEGEAYDTNNRTHGGANWRDTYRGGTDDPAYTYMGRWADGCTITSLAGQTVIIEWDYGSEVWRQTTLEPGHSHTIAFGTDAVGNAEDGAMIETGSAAPTLVRIENCTPGPVDGQ